MAALAIWALGALGLAGGGIGVAALLGGGPWMLMAAKWLWSWLSHATFLQVVCGALAIALALDHAGLLIAHRHSAKVESQLSQCTAARHADYEAYTEAQADAQVANKAQVTKVEQQYQRNSDNERQAYLSDRAKLIAYYDGLRAKAAQGSPRSTAPSPNRAAPGGADGNGLPLSAGDDLQTQQDAAEIELRLLHLQQYVTGLLAIDPNSPPQAPQQP